MEGVQGLPGVRRGRDSIDIVLVPMNSHVIICQEQAPVKSESKVPICSRLFQSLSITFALHPR